MVTGKVSSLFLHLEQHTCTDFTLDVLAIVTTVPLALLRFLSTV